MEELTKWLEISDLKLVEKETGIPYDRMYKWRRGMSKPKTEDYNTLIAYFKGKSSIDGNPRLEVKPVIEARPLRLADPFGFEATGLKFYTLADGSEMMQVPVIPVKAYGGYLRGHADPEWFDAMNFDTMTVPVDKQHKGIYMAFEMDGNSMVNITTEEYARKSLWPGQRIIGRDLKKEHWKHKLHMHNNEAWIIVHRERGIVVKDITEHDILTGRIRCHSWNPNKEEHPDFEIYLEDVEQLMNVVDPFGKMKPY